MSASRRFLAVTAVAAPLIFPGTAASAAAKTYALVIDQMKFGPIPSGLRKGDVLIWINRDMLRHSATAVNGVFDIDLPAGARKRMVLTRTGSFPFTCRYHPGMRGTLSIGG
jgi:plastocyanin